MIDRIRYLNVMDVMQAVSRSVEILHVWELMINVLCILLPVVMLNRRKSHSTR